MRRRRVGSRRGGLGHVAAGWVTSRRRRATTPNSNQKKGWALEYPWAQYSPYDFVCAAVINGKVVSEERGTTRRMARENASQRASQALRTEPTRQPFALEVGARVSSCASIAQSFLFLARRTRNPALVVIFL